MTPLPSGQPDAKLGCSKELSSMTNPHFSSSTEKLKIRVAPGVVKSTDSLFCLYRVKELLMLYCL